MLCLLASQITLTWENCVLPFSGLVGVSCWSMVIVQSFSPAAELPTLQEASVIWLGCSCVRVKLCVSCKKDQCKCYRISCAMVICVKRCLNISAIQCRQMHGTHTNNASIPMPTSLLVGWAITSMGSSVHPSSHLSDCLSVCLPVLIC